MKPSNSRSSLTATSHDLKESTKRRKINPSNVSDDRKYFKNISIYITELPATPRKFRDKYTRDYVPNQMEETSIKAVAARWLEPRSSDSTKEHVRQSSGLHVETEPQSRRSRTALMRNVTKAVASFRTATWATPHRPSLRNSRVFNSATRTSKAAEHPDFEERCPLDGLYWTDLRTWLQNLFPGLPFGEYKVLLSHLVTMSLHYPR